MLIDEWQIRRKQEGISGEKEIKVKIPLDYHIKLHTVKVVKGQNISETVTAALSRYFETMRDNSGGVEAAPRLSES